MVIKVAFSVNADTGEKEIISFSCHRSDKVRIRDLCENEALVHGSSVPQRFYSHWDEYVLEGTTLRWSDSIVARKSLASSVAVSTKK